MGGKDKSIIFGGKNDRHWNVSLDVENSELKRAREYHIRRGKQREQRNKEKHINNIGWQ